MTVLSVLVPLALGGKARGSGKIDGDVVFEVESNWLAKTLTVIRFLAMLSIYAGFTAVVCSVFTIKHPEGDELTPPLSATMQCAPMLAVLFIGTRMRALQLSDNKGAPQAWVQAGMYLATWSVMIQFTMCLLMPLCGKKYTPDSLDKPA